MPLSAVLDALENIRHRPGMDNTSTSEAAGLLTKIGTFEFMLTVGIARSILGITKGFAEFLQQPTINLLQFYDYAESVFEYLKEHRLKSQYTEIYESVKESKILMYQPPSDLEEVKVLCVL